MAEDFRKAMGETEEDFRFCVRQTLNGLMQKEEEPVKKKISLGLVLAMVVVLLGAVGAMAAGNWGILGYLEQQGKTPAEDMLELYGHQTVQYDDDISLFTMTVEEGLYEDEILYLAVTVRPLEENTLVVPCPENTKTHRTDEITMNQAMGTNDYDNNLTVLDYAKDKGFDHVVLHSTPSVFMSTFSGMDNKITNTDAVAYALQEDGSLCMILQKHFTGGEKIRFPEQTEQLTIAADAYKSDVKDEGAWLWGTGCIVTVNFDRFRSELARRSIESDAHDIVGYRGFVDSITVAPYEDYAAVIIRLDKTRPENDQTWMSGPYWAVLDDEGNRLCYVEMKMSQYIYDEALDKPSQEICYGTIPLTCVPAGKTFTLQAENWNNPNIVYDKHTYTLE